MLLAALPIAWTSHRFAEKACTAPAMVTSLLAGPLHAEVEVNPGNGRSFSYVENSSRQPLSVGQHVTVRYDPARPEASAQVASVGIYRTAVEVALTGTVMILMALCSPMLVRAFPTLLTFSLRGRL